MCRVRLRHKVKTTKWTLFVVPEDGSAMPGMPDIEVLDILKIMCKVMGDPHQRGSLTHTQYRHPMSLAAKQSQTDQDR